MRSFIRPYLLSFIFLALLLYQCDSNRVYESNIDFGDRIWLAEDTKRFSLSIPDSISRYNLYCNVRNTLDYPNYNLYIKYWLYDSIGRPLKSDLKNIELFDPETGFPNGKSSLGDIFEYQIPLLTNYEFRSPGNYTLVFQHFMRYDTLREVISLGVRLERSSDNL